MPNGTLTGHSIKMALLNADHTYVTSSAGHTWPCFGRGNGGTQICHGFGNVEIAACLSNPNSQAGIVYGVTGVCHQTANRIVYPSRQTVSAAQGYRWSIFTYGSYGKEALTLRPFSPLHYPWPELAACNGHSRP